jgi:dimethylamine monooxygenase subunit A
VAPSRATLPPQSLDGAPFRWTMGLHRLEESDWLDVDAQREVELAHKARLLADARDVVLVALPEGTAPSAELHELVVDNLATHHPGVTASVSHAGDRDPLEAAALAVQEDLCVLAHDDAWRLVAACVCFPSRWSLKEKLGATLEGIHAPVPGFDLALAAPATRFFDRLDVARPVWRSNWTLLDTPELHLPSGDARGTAPDARGRRDLDAADVASRLWFRVERQTLRRLPTTDAIAFTIRTTVRPLAEALASAPGAAAALAATLATVPADVAAYKGWVGLLTPLRDWLAAPERGPAAR